VADGVDDDVGGAELLRLFKPLPCELLRLDRASLGDDRDAELLAERLQLLCGGHASRVSADEQRPLSGPSQVKS